VSSNAPESEPEMSLTPQIRRKAIATNIAIGGSICVGLLVAALTIFSGPKEQATAPSAVIEAPTPKDWPMIASQALKSAGYAFALPALEDGILSISGDAPDAISRTRAFDIGVKAILSDKAHIGYVLAFDNAMTIAGETITSVPDAASALGSAPQAQACQTAYNTLLKGRVIHFGSASAVLADDSKPLLDALAAVAIRCETYRVELGGHTDPMGDPTANQALSERRAQSVADYLVSKSVPAAQLGVIGYGETKPIDKTGSAEADAKNRRIEFKVAEGGN
jgi:outer membrane protein OmpA-like peptidoglycan-associated protein